MSCVVINCTQELIFKHESVAVQMRYMNFAFAQVPSTILSLCAIIKLAAGSQLSVAVATPVAEEFEFASQLMVRSAGQTITGFVVS